jgi:predicted ABC-type ATPase
MNEMIKQPAIFVLGGPNGAGKSTAAPILLPNTLGITQFVNADLIAEGLSPFAPDSTAIQAGRLMLARINELSSKKESFGFETTLASKMFESFLLAKKQQGYSIHIIFLWLNSYELAVSRVKERVMQGGHNVPSEDIIRRYKRGLKNFLKIYQPIADSWTLCDNSSNELVIIAQGGFSKTVSIYEKKIYEMILKDIKGY